VPNTYQVWGEAVPFSYWLLARYEYPAKESLIDDYVLGADFLPKFLKTSLEQEKEIFEPLRELMGNEFKIMLESLVALAPITSTDWQTGIQNIKAILATYWTDNPEMLDIPDIELIQDGFNDLLEILEIVGTDQDYLNLVLNPTLVQVSGAVIPDDFIYTLGENERALSADDQLLFKIRLGSETPLSTYAETLAGPASVLDIPEIYLVRKRLLDEVTQILEKGFLAWPVGTPDPSLFPEPVYWWYEETPGSGWITLEGRLDGLITDIPTWLTDYGITAAPTTDDVFIDLINNFKDLLEDIKLSFLHL